MKDKLIIKCVLCLYFQPRPVYAHVAGVNNTAAMCGVNGVAGSSEMVELRAHGNKLATSAPGIEAAPHSLSSSQYGRGGNAARGLHSSSSGYDSCPAALQIGSGVTGTALTQSTCTLAATTTIDHSPHRRCFLRHPRLSCSPVADFVPISAQQCHL